MTSNVIKIGGGWYTDDAEYVVTRTASGWKVTRGDGSFAEFVDSADADEAAEMLAKGDKDDSDYEWLDV